MPNPAGARQYGNFITLADARGWLQFSTPTTESSKDPQLQRVVDMACTWAQNFIGRPAGDQEFFERHDGWSGEYIMLKESPVIEVVTCQEYKSSGGTQTLPESTPTTPVTGIQIDYATGRIMRTFAGYSWPRTFFPGSRNIEVKYRAGYNPTPPDIWVATMEMVAHWWRNVFQEGGLKAAGTGAANEYDPLVTTAGLWQGVPNRIVGLLSLYRRVGIA